MSLPPLRLNPALRAEDFASSYAANKFVQIQNVFEPALAEAIAEVLKQVPWRLCYHDPEVGTVQLTQAEIQSIGQQGMAQRMQKVMALASQNHGYCYNTLHLTRDLPPSMDASHPLRQLTDFLLGDEFLSFGGTVIGHPNITQVDAHATLYTRGSFLTRHVDEGHNRERRAAFTLSFCANWQTDWGGLLMFLDKQTTDVTSAWVPRFNALTIFDGLRVHSVSPVSPFAGGGRYSIAGWLRDDPVMGE